MEFRYILLLPILTLNFIIGCGGTNANEEANTLRIGNGGEPRDLDPQTISGMPEVSILSSLLEGLVTYHPTDDNIPYPGVAESWEVSEDNLTWTFHLREDAKWSNGDPVTASDFQFSWKRALTPSLACEYADWLYFIKGAEDYNLEKTNDFKSVGIKVPDPHQLVIELEYPVPDLLKLLLNHTFLPVHPKTVTSFGGDTQRASGWTQPESFVGNGPFRLVKWVPNSVIRVEPNPHYWDVETVQLDAIEFYPISSEATEIQAFESGQLHITNTVPANKRPYYRENFPNLIRFDPYMGSYFYRVNTTKAPLDNPKLREALSLTIDRQLIVDQLTKGGEVPAQGYVPFGIKDYEPASIEQFNPEKARKLLQESGINPQELPPIDLLYNTAENHRKIAEAIQQMWERELGIKVILTNQEWQVYLNNIKEFNYDIARAGWIGNLYPNSFLQNYLSYSQNNDVGFDDPVYDQLYEQALQTVEPELRNSLFQQAEQRLIDSKAVIPIYYYTNSFLIKPEVHGWNPKIIGQYSLKNVYLTNDSKD